MVLILVTQVIIITAHAMPDNSIITDNKEALMNNQLEIVIDLNRKTYKLGEPIIINGEIKNLTNNTINLAPMLYMNLLVYLKFEDKNTAIPFGPKILLQEIIKKEDITELSPGASYSFRRIISKEMYLMPKETGEYELYVEYSNKTTQIEEKRLWEGKLKSNTVKFRLGSEIPG